MKKKKRKLKKRNLFLLIVILILSLCILIEISYTHWILSGGPNALTAEASDDVKSCLRKHHPLLGDCLFSIASKHPEELSKLDPDKNLRYIGNNPNNYIDLGETYQTEIYRGYSKTDETDYKDFIDISECLAENRKCSLFAKQNDPILWRIVGVFHLNGLTYTKLVRESSIGKYSWDSSTVDINDGLGTNEWSNSDLYDLLNQSYFYNQEKGQCSIDKLQTKTTCDFSQIGLNTQAKEYIFLTDWNLGSMDEQSFESALVNDWYTKERAIHTKGCLTGPYCTDTLERQNRYQFFVGLLYPSDLGYATNEEKCLTIPLSTWNKKENQECITNNWLMSSKPSSWLLTPLSFESSNAYVTTYSKTYGLKETFADVAAEIYPVIYLKHEVKIAGGFGTKEKPYVIK